MYDIQFGAMHEYLARPRVPGGRHPEQLARSLVALYEHAHSRARVRRAMSMLFRTSSNLLWLNDEKIRRRAHEAYYDGVQSVEIRQIRGTEGRRCDFDNRFEPLHEGSRARWLSIALARKAGVAMPPIRVVRLGELYFVRDGHHRISVARLLGEKFIDAEVTVWISEERVVPERVVAPAWGQMAAAT